MIAPIATAAAKSIAVHCARVRRCATRRPSTAVAYISAALPKTPTSSPVCPLNHAGMAPPARLVGAGAPTPSRARSSPRAQRCLRAVGDLELVEDPAHVV